MDCLKRKPKSEKEMNKNVPDVYNIDILEGFLKVGKTRPVPPLTEIVKDEIWIVDNFFTKEECEYLIKISEDLGYVDALVNVGYGMQVLDKGYRDSKRVMIDDIKFAEYLTERCMQYLPRAYEGAELVNMNERFRFLKYDEPGNKFEAHCDGVFARSYDEQTTTTIQFYLNEGMRGGATTFFHDTFKNVKQINCVISRESLNVFLKLEELSSLDISIRWLHEGSELKEGLKYTIRNDFLYRWLKEEEFKDFKSKKCLKCGHDTELVKLDSCRHQIIMCRCSPYNYYCASEKGYPGKCHYCGNGIRLPENLEKLARKYELKS